MLYHVVRRPPHHSATTSSNQSKLSPRGGSVPPPTLMPRYHYSRIVPTNPTESAPIRTQYDGQTTKPHMTPTTITTLTGNNNNNYHPSFKSTIIPLVTTHRTTTPTNKREFVPIPVTREDGTSIITHHQNRTIPINFINETNVLPPTVNNNNSGNANPRPLFTNLLRPTSRYFQHHYNTNSNEEPMPTSTITAATASNVPRLPAVSRRLSLTIPVTTSGSTNVDDDTIKQSNPSSPTRQIPVRLLQSPTILTTTHVSTPPTNSRISSAILRTSPVSNALRRQQTEIGENSLSSPTLPTQTPIDLITSSPIRRAEVMAREAIQGIARLQQQRNNSQADSNRSPPLSRRVIINLKNNQSISLDSRLSSPLRPPPIPSSTRLPQRNNLYHIPVLHEIQLPPHPPTVISENSSLLSTIASSQNGNFKNEFHMEIPVTNHDQENRLERIDEIHLRKRISSANQNSHQTLKSILKRSSSRETVSRKTVSFVNA